MEEKKSSLYKIFFSQKRKKKLIRHPATIYMVSDSLNYTFSSESPWSSQEIKKTNKNNSYFLRIKDGHVPNIQLMHL
jgi:hypothetical protein